MGGPLESSDHGGQRLRPVAPPESETEGYAFRRHLLSESWCTECVMERDQQAPHRANTTQLAAVPIVQFDCGS